MRHATWIGRAVTVAGWLAAAAAASAMTPPPACQAPLAAMSKQIVTPTHIVATSKTRGVPPKVVESIYSGGVIYIKVKGTWKRSPVSVEEMRQQESQNVRDATSMTCTRLRDEVVDGEPAAVFQVRSVNGQTSTATLWVSSRTGLPLRSSNDLESSSDQTGTGVHLEIRYDYQDVRPPAGVK